MKKEKKRYVGKKEELRCNFSENKTHERLFPHPRRRLQHRVNKQRKKQHWRGTKVDLNTIIWISFVNFPAKCLSAFLVFLYTCNAVVFCLLFVSISGLLSTVHTYIFSCVSGHYVSPAYLSPSTGVIITSLLLYMSSCFVTSVYGGQFLLYFSFIIICSSLVAFLSLFFCSGLFDYLLLHFSHFHSIIVCFCYLIAIVC